MCACEIFRACFFGQYLFSLWMGKNASNASNLKRNRIRSSDPNSHENRFQRTQTHRTQHGMINIYSINTSMLLCKFNDSAQRLPPFSKGMFIFIFRIMGRVKSEKEKKTINTLFVHTFSARAWNTMQAHWMGGVVEKIARYIFLFTNLLTHSLLSAFFLSLFCLFLFTFPFWFSFI